MIQKFSENLGLVGIVVTLGILMMVLHFVGIDGLKNAVLSAGIWAPVVFILLKISTIVVVPLSGTPLYPLAGAFFGFWHGLIYIIIGDFLGFTISFWISRKFGYPIVAKLIAKGEQVFLKKVIDHAGTTKGLLHIIMTFFAMPEIISYGTGLSKLPYLKFISILWPISWIGSIILVFTGASLGLTSDSLLISLALPLIAVVLIGFGIFFFFRSVQKKK